jgi:hypothetical protein
MFAATGVPRKRQRVSGGGASLTALWVAWLLTLTAVFVFAWVAAERCMGWLLPWIIGIIVLGVGVAVFRRRPR